MIYTSSINKILLAVAIILFSAFIASAQRPFDKSLYHVAIGAKYYALGISVKVSSGPADNLEGQLFKTASNTRLCMLYEFHRAITEELNWYAGWGSHFSVWDPNWKEAHHMYGSDASIGVDGIGGFDYKPENMPIDISLDWQPALTFMGVNNGRNKLELLFGGISIRLAL